MEVYMDRLIKITAFMRRKEGTKYAFETTPLYLKMQRTMRLLEEGLGWKYDEGYGSL